MNEDLFNRNQFLEDIIENIPGGVFQFCISDDGTMRFRYQSQRAYKLAHLPPDWHLGINAHPDDRDRLIKSVHEAVRTISPWSFEVRYITASGDVRWLQGLARPIKTQDEIVYNGILLDITERKKAEDSLYESNERFRNAFNNAAIGMALVSPVGQYIKVNRSLCEMLGYPEQELLQLTYHDITHPDDLETSRRCAHRLLLGEITSYLIEKRYIRKSGEIVWVLLSVSGVRDDAGNPLYAVSQFQDITERKLAEQEKQRFYRETIKSVTQGKLDLVPFDEVKDYLDFAELDMEITSYADTTTARKEIREFCEIRGCGNNRWDLFELALGEAMTNAIKHAGTGRVYAGLHSDNIWTAISDDGPGMSALTLPKATLRRGFSTKISMGIGYSLILEACDCVLLNTGPEGTTVVMLMDVVVSEHVMSLDELPDTWDHI